MVARARAVGDALAARGIAAVGIKGIALIDAYPSTAGRAIGDVDVLVAPGDVPAALETLATLGLRPIHDVTPLVLDQRHAVVTRADDGIWVDLHWRVSAGLPIGVVRRVAAQAGPMVPGRPAPEGHPLHGSGLLVPSVADQLAIVAVHGCRPANAGVGHLADDARALVAANPDLTPAEVADALGRLVHRWRGQVWLAGVLDGRPDVDDATAPVSLWDSPPGRGPFHERLAARLEVWASSGRRSVGASAGRQAAAAVASSAAVTTDAPWRFPGQLARRIRWERSAERAAALEALSGLGH